MDKSTLTPKELQWLDNRNEIATFERLLAESQDDPEAIRDLTLTLAALRSVQGKLLSKAEQEALLQRLANDENLLHEARWNFAVRAGFARLAYQNAQKDNWSAYYKWWPLGLLLLLFMAGGYLWLNSEPSEKHSEPMKQEDQIDHDTSIGNKTPGTPIDTVKTIPPPPDDPRPKSKTTILISDLIWTAVNPNPDIGFFDTLSIIKSSISIDQYNQYATQVGISKIKAKDVSQPVRVDATQIHHFIEAYKYGRDSTKYAAIPTRKHLTRAIGRGKTTIIEKDPSINEWVIGDNGKLQVLTTNCRGNNCNSSHYETRPPANNERCAFRLVVVK